MTLTNPRVEAARVGIEPAFICKLPSGWVFLCNLQYLRGYCILQADPVVESINDLDDTARAQVICDMILVGDAIMEVTGAYRVNYFIGGNTQSDLHAHVVPRYLSEPEELRKDQPWAHPDAYAESTRINLERDKPLMQELGMAIQKLSAQHNPL